MSYDRHIVECCNNDKRYPERMIVHGNVKDHGKLVFHKLPVNEESQKGWIHSGLDNRTYCYIFDLYLFRIRRNRFFTF